MSATDKVRRMAENDDPKCGNCRHWKDFNIVTEFQSSRARVCMFNKIGFGRELRTLDLSLCSAWEPKEPTA